MRPTRILLFGMRLTAPSTTLNSEQFPQLIHLRNCNRALLTALPNSALSSMQIRLLQSNFKMSQESRQSAILVARVKSRFDFAREGIPL